MVKSGQTVSATVTVKNTGTESHTFPVGFTIRHVSTNKDYDISLQNLTLNAGSSSSKTFSWTVPSTAPTGSYSMIAAVWTSSSNGVLSGRLNDMVVANAFSVS